jgi:phosphoesterase RecJ-like protein
VKELFSQPHGSYLMLAHVYPDGDVLGSQMGLGLSLIAAGRSVTFAGPHAIPENYLFLPGASLHNEWRGGKTGYDVIVMVDCPDPDRTEGLFEGSRGGSVVVNIDHHPDNKRYGHVNWIDPAAAATGEMVYDLLAELDLPMTKDVATNLYTAILTDTGSFRYSNVSPKTLMVASQLVTAGADPADVASHLFETRAPGTLSALGRLLQEVKLSPDGMVAWLELPNGSVSQEIIEAEDLVTYPRSIRTVKVSLLLREIGGGEVKASLRAKGEVDVGKIAAVFGGGGHRNAAGCTLKGTLESARETLLRAVDEALEHLRGKSGS